MECRRAHRSLVKELKAQLMPTPLFAASVQGHLAVCKVCPVLRVIAY